MVLRNKTYKHNANVETWQLCFVLRRSCEKNPVDWTRKVAKFRPPHKVVSANLNFLECLFSTSTVFSLSFSKFIVPHALPLAHIK